jgi:Carboxypeptidase regulatory-like domain
MRLRLLLTVLLLSCASVAYAQFDTGQISGIVRDSSNAGVPGATITVENEANRDKRIAVTDSSGFYAVPDLPVGTYTVTIELSGFKRFIKTGIKLSAAAQIGVDTQLEVGRLEETVEVKASTSAVQSGTAQVARTVDARQIQETTLNGRNPIFLALLKPGVRGGLMSTFNPDSVTNGSFSINGAREDEYVVTVDGAIATRTRSSGSMLGAQDVETVEEVQILTANYRAEYGRSSAGQIRFVTKSGSRDFHGDVLENYRDESLDANSWTRNRSGDPRLSNGPDPFTFHQFGFHAGGPIMLPGGFNANRSRMFFFWGEEWIYRRDTSTSTGTVPTAAMRRGDFSELLNAANPFFGRTRTVTDPTTGQQFPGNIIPPERLSTNGVALLNAYPLPTAGFQQGTSNWIGTQSTWSDLRKDTLKVDYLITPSQRLTFRGTHIPWHFNEPFVGNFDRAQWKWSRPNRTAAVSLNSVLSSTLLNEFTFSMNSDGKGDIGMNPDCVQQVCDRSTYGINFPFLFPGTKEFENKVPTIRVTGLSTIDGGPYPGYWSGYVFAWANNLTKVIGRHTTKYGVFIEYSGQDDYIQFTTASQGATNNQNGEVRFLDTGHPQSTGLAMGNAALGSFSDYTEMGKKALTPWAATALDWYAQDNWKASSKLTIEAGVRYSLWPPWHSKWGNIAMFHPDYYNPAVAAVVDRTGGFITSGDRYNGIVLPGDSPPAGAGDHVPELASGEFNRLYHGLPDGFSKTHKNLFQPRLGFAYAINNRTALRSGFGLFYNRTMINRDTALGGNPPFQPQQTVINGNIDAPGGAGAVRREFPFVMTMQDPEFKIPAAWNWNVTLERELPWSITAEVAYVGRKGVNNQRKRNINQLQPGTIQANPGVNPNALRPYSGFAVIGLAENSGRSQYHGLQLSVERRVAKGLHAGLAYTYSRAYDDSSNLTDVLPNSYDDSAYWGISDNDRPHVLIVNYIYELPFGRGTGWLDKLLGNWDVSGVYQYQSGSPFSVRSSDDFAGVGPGSGAQFWNQIADPHVTPSGDFTTGIVWFNKDAFARPAAGTFGVQPRNGLRNPPFWATDFGLRKTVPLAGSHRLQFRFDAFNVLNHPNWNGPNSNPTSGSFGLITGKNGERRIQLAAKYMF